MTNQTEPGPIPARDYNYRWYWHLRPVRGKRGLEIDKWCVAHLGLSPMLVEASLGRRLPIPPSLLLTTVGKSSGALRSVVLPYESYQGELLVFASNGGKVADPMWVGNLRSEPRAWITMKRRQHVVDSRIVTGSERAALMDVLRPRRPHVDMYEARTEGEREIALVALSPHDPTEVFA